MVPIVASKGVTTVVLCHIVDSVTGRVVRLHRAVTVHSRLARVRIITVNPLRCSDCWPATAKQLQRRMTEVAAGSTVDYPVDAGACRTQGGSDVDNILTE